MAFDLPPPNLASQPVFGLRRSRSAPNLQKADCAESPFESDSVKKTIRPSLVTGPYFSDDEIPSVEVHAKVLPEDPLFLDRVVSADHVAQRLAEYRAGALAASRLDDSARVVAEHRENGTRSIYSNVPAAFTQEPEPTLKLKPLVKTPSQKVAPPRQLLRQERAKRIIHKSLPKQQRTSSVAACVFGLSSVAIFVISAVVLFEAVVTANAQEDRTIAHMKELHKLGKIDHGTLYGEPSGNGLIEA